MKVNSSPKVKVFVAMSGGVDSSVAAALLKEAGFDVVGVFMKNWSYETVAHNSGCTFEEDQRSARDAAAVLNIPLYTWDFESEYRKRIVEYMIDSYASGSTPNPDVMCNKEIKFGLFLEKALKLGADLIATGHYARLKSIKRKNANEYKLFAGIDKNKDQTYFLWTLKQDQLRRSLFPIGEFTKPEVRKLAKKFKLPNAERKDSQGLCFVGKVDFKEFLTNWIPVKPGKVITTSGKVIGRHEGVQYYTIGQRHGIGIGGGEPYFVVAKDAATNVLTVAEGPDDSSLWQKELKAENLNWISGKAPEFPTKCFARIRYRQPLELCMIRSEDPGSINVVFGKSQRAVAAGQSIVLYDATGEVLGGGVIRGNQ